jgi:nicotinamide riboside kinase
MPKLNIAITGPECCGKSTLASDLASMFNVNYIKEYAVTYLKDKGSNYTYIDIEKIAIKQNELILSNHNEQLLIVDTEALVNKIWFEEKYNSTNNTINLLWEKQNFDIYFLCYPDIDWEFSDFRENPNNRLQLFEKYESYLISCFRKYYVVKGTRNERLQYCINIIKQLIL